MVKETPPPAECANCGAAIPRTAKSCPECGADERTGWRDNESTRYDGLDLPDSAFADEHAPDSLPSRNPRREVNGIPWYWWCLAVALVFALALAFLK